MLSIKRRDLITGITSLCIGIFVLIINLNISDFKITSEVIIFIILIMVAGYSVARYFISQSHNSWSLFLTFLSIALLSFLVTKHFGANNKASWGIMILVFGLGLFILYGLNKKDWWIIIPGGIILSIIPVIFIDGKSGVGIMFLANGSIFLLINRILKNQNDQYISWPLIPAGVLLFLGILFLAIDLKLSFNLLLSLMLIIIGSYIVLNNFNK